MQSAKQFFNKYKHGLWIAVFSLIYMILFYYLEHRPVYRYHVIHTTLDNLIPFCEYFVIPYLLWFPYMFIAVLYFIFRNDDKQEYYRLAKNLMMGMSLFILISFLYPNGHQLRPVSFPRDNFFVHLVQHLYATDTPTNILPSIHVFNSLAIHTAIASCKKLHKYSFVNVASLFLTISIVLSTMFLKQHSVIDVCMGTGLALIGYALFYREPATARRRASAYAHHTR